MRNEQDLINNKFYVISNYIMYFFITNMCFLFCISPLLIYRFLYNGNSKVITLILSISIGPALSTLFSTMGKFVREKDISPLKDFFHFYKMNFFQGVIAGTIFNSLISILYFDIIYFISTHKIVQMYLMFIMILLVCLISMYGYLIISRYNVKILFLLKTSLVLTIKKFYVSLTCLAISIIILGIIRFARISFVGLLFGSSVLSYLILKIQMPTIEQLKEAIEQKYNN